MSSIEISTIAKNDTQQKNNIAYSLSDEAINIKKLEKSGWVVNNGNLNIDNIKTIKNNKNKIIAVINAYTATDAEKLSSIDKAKLDNCWFIDSLWISPDVPVSEAADLALYCGIKTARIYNKDIVITIKNKQNNFPILTLLKAETIQDLDQDHILIGQKVDYALLKIADDLPTDSRDFITAEFVNDMYKMFFHWYDQYNASTWCQAVMNGKLTRKQYISTLNNLHSYVQYTTRICARAVAHCDDVFLRNNYIEHFRGEINHEILIQKDLMQLDGDVDYLKNYFIPNTKTKAFMILQESTIGFYQDPILLLACPFVAEGISANFKTELLDNLEKIIGSWGVKEPGKAMRFFNSHVKFDGGDDGHWEDVIKILPLYVKNEHDRQKFISITKFGMDALLDSFDSNVKENLIW